MAEIKIEKKTPLWFWALLALVVIALLVYFFSLKGNDEALLTQIEAVPVEVVPVMTDSNTSAVGRYVQYVNEGGTMSLDHAYTHAAILRLADAINERAQQGNHDLSLDLEKARSYANEITKEPLETTHALTIRKAADILANAMEKIQVRNHPNLNTEFDEVRKAANSIRPDVLTLRQREPVKTFFRESAELLQKM